MIDTSTHNLVPVIELGGTHVAVAIVDARAGRVVASTARRAPIDANASADDLLAALLGAARSLPPRHGGRWAAAVPGPFDTDTGVARYESVGKFDALNGVDVGAALRDGLGAACTSITFLNDADAYAVGEHVAGAGRVYERFCGLTLGTGVGSGWIDRGMLTDGGIPGGEVHLLEFEGHRIEERMSRRAIRAEYALRTRGNGAVPDVPDVREIAERARGGDGVARGVLDDAFSFLGRAMRGPLRRFGADAVVVGGAMSGSWDIFLPAYLHGVGRGASFDVVPAALGHDAPMIGAAASIPVLGP